MSITCNICQRSFTKQISNSHLKTHGMTTLEYKALYGVDSLSCAEYRAERAVSMSGENNPNFNKRHTWTDEQKLNIKGREAHNKGKKVTDEALLAKIQAAIDKREAKYAEGILTRHIHSHTDEQRQVLSQRQIDYAAANPDKMSARALKAIETLREKGFDLGSKMRGKKQTAHAKAILAQHRVANNEKRAAKSQKNIRDRADELNATLQSEVTDSIIRLHCNTCNTDYSFTSQMFDDCRFKSTLCPTCHPRHKRQSRAELEIFEYVKTLRPSAIASYRAHYHDKEIDVFIPELNIGIEFNGLYWHSETVLTANGRSPQHDFKKWKEFKEKGIRLLVIFEDEWEFKQEIVKSRLSNILGATRRRVYARKCLVRAVSSKEASVFCDTNHIMGRGRSNIRLGLYHEDKLVSLMTFTTSNISRKLKEAWEINRFASVLGVSVVGGASKLFKAFVSQIQPAKVISYADNRWSDGGLYQQLGFEFTGAGTANYWYTQQNSLVRIHRYALRKNAADDQLLTEYENRLKQGFTRIWDCGSSKWCWRKKAH